MLGKLVVHLKANYGHLTAGLRTAGNAVVSTSQSITRGVRGAVGGIAGLSVVGGLIAGVTTALKDLDNVADLSALTGNSSGAIAGLGMAAQLTGSDLETLQSGLKKYSTIAGNALGGSKSAQQDLAALGLTLHDLQTLTPDQQILKIADSIARLPTEAQRNAAAMSAFGKAGAELAPMLARGSAGLTEFIDKARDMGLDIPSSDLASIGAANDAIDKLKMTISGMFGQIAVAVAPSIVSISEGIQSWIAHFGGVGGIMATVQSIWKTTQNAIATGIVYAMAIGEFAFTHWREIAELAFSGTALAAVQYFNRLIYFYGTVLPTLFKWFSDNWSTIWHSAFDLVRTIFINMRKNIRNIMKEIWDFISSGGTDALEFSWTPLTEGFVNSIKELPDIPDRVIGPIEEGLQQRVDELGASLGNGLGTMVRDRLAELESIQAQAATASSGTAGLPTSSASDNPESGSPGGGSGSSKGGGAALLKGSADAFSAIFAASRGGHQNKQLAATQQTAKATQQVAENTSTIATALSNGVKLATVESF